MIIGKPERGFDLAAHDHKKIKYSLSKNNQLCQAVADAVAGDKECWTLTEWNELLNLIENSELTIKQFLTENFHDKS